MDSLGSRLKKALEDSGVTQAELAEHIGISQQAVQFICSGKTKHTKHLGKIAERLGVTQEWLAFGSANQVYEAQSEYNAQTQSVPLLTMRDLDNDSVSTLAITCPFEHSPKAFALKIEGDPASANPMHPQYGRAYPVGSIVFADPALADTCENNDIVIAELTERPNKVTAFRQLYKEAGTEALRPLNPQFPMTTEPFRIVAKVIGAILP